MGAVLRVVLALVLAGCAPSAEELEATALEQTTGRLRLLLEDVAGATASRYDARDDRGHELDGLAILPAGGGDGFVGVSHWWSEPHTEFRVALSTSQDLMNWTWRLDLARRASMPTIAPASDGGYVVAWEQEPDNHLAFAWYTSWANLLAGEPSKRFEAEQQLSDCAEGTPHLTNASSAAVTFTFHYFRECSRDREAQGTMDWSSWSSARRLDLDAAILEHGVQGGIGDRVSLGFEGHDFELVEAMGVNDDWTTWRVYLVDENLHAARLDVRTGYGNQAFTNPTAQLVTINGQESLFVSLFVPMEGSGEAPPGELLFYVPVEEAPNASGPHVVNEAVAPYPQPAPPPRQP